MTEKDVYLSSRGKIVLNACPGSGKTTAIVDKLPFLEKECIEKCGVFSGVATLSFSNVAKDEIADKYFRKYSKKISYPNTNQTLDSFIATYITLPFIHKILGEKNLKIFDREMFSTFNERFKSFCRQNLATNLTELREIIFLDFYNDFSINIKGEPTFKNNPIQKGTFKYKIFKELHTKKVQAGILTMGDSSYYGYLLLKRNPQLAKYLITKFPYLIIDEAQDISELQDAFLELLVEAGLENIELIGDPFQCIYEWRNAKPNNFLKGWPQINFVNNYRSNKNIVGICNLLRPTTEKEMECASVNCLDEKIVISTYSSVSELIGKVQDFSAKCNSLSLKDNRVLVRSNGMVSKILNVPEDTTFWQVDIPLYIIKAHHNFLRGEIKDSIKAFRKLLLKIKYKDKSSSELFALEKESVIKIELNIIAYSILKEFPDYEKSIEDWSKELELLIKNKLEITTSIEDFFMVKKTMQIGSGKRDATFKTRKMSEFFVQNNKLGIDVSTIHAVKGRTLDSVMLVFGVNGEFRVNKIEKPSDFPTEVQRLIYVALSRPAHLLHIMIPASADKEKIKAILPKDTYTW